MITAEELLETQGLAVTKENIDQLVREAELERARKSLLYFTKFTFPIYKADPLHIMIADILTRKPLSQPISKRQQGYWQMRHRRL